ncbi:hypothetical protein [Ascidiimonas aurantiaca]|uniref:hypothetical protein n=1 Tax=Ascidiimonas aurantiaca TaxID=1685432 RepID=UPI0030ED9C05
MLKKLRNLNGVRELSKAEQKNIRGGTCDTVRDFEIAFDGCYHDLGIKDDDAALTNCINFACDILSEDDIRPR